jgi:hypothetical protein
VAGDVGAIDAAELIGVGIDFGELEGVAANECEVMAWAPGGLEAGLVGLELLSGEESWVTVAAWRGV